MGIFDRMRGGHIRVHVVIRGHIGEQWRAIDEYIRVPSGTTLAKLVEVADNAGVPLREAIEKAPQLVAALTLNGAPCHYQDHRDRVLADGDELNLTDRSSPPS